MALFAPDKTKCFIQFPKSGSSYVESVLTAYGWIRRGRHDPVQYLDREHTFYSTIRDPWTWYESVWCAAQRECPWRYKHLAFPQALNWWMAPLERIPRGSWPAIDNLAGMGEPPFSSLWTTTVKFFTYETSGKLGAKLLPLASIRQCLVHEFEIPAHSLPHPDVKINAREPDQQIVWTSQMIDLVARHDGLLWEEFGFDGDPVWLAKE